MFALGEVIMKSKVLLVGLGLWLIATSSAFAETTQLDFDSYMQASLVGEEIKRETHKRTWKLGKENGWRLDQRRGYVYWVFDDGLLARAPVQIVGTYNQEDKTFLWSWDHKTVLEPLREHASLAKSFGEKHSIPMLIERKVTVSEDEAWGLAAVASRLAGAKGLYRAETDGPLVYLTFGDVELNKAVPEG